MLIIDKEASSDKREQRLKMGGNSDQKGAEGTPMMDMKSYIRQTISSCLL